MEQEAITMITLKIEPYCHKCSEFEPKVKKNLIQCVGEYKAGAETVVYCEHADRCDSMVDFLKRLVGKK